MSKLSEQMRNTLRVNHDAYSTEKEYINCCKRYIRRSFATHLPESGSGGTGKSSTGVSFHLAPSSISITGMPSLIG